MVAELDELLEVDELEELLPGPVMGVAPSVRSFIRLITDAIDAMLPS
jgi:hypothetical protein